MSKRSVALVGVLIIMVTIWSVVIGAMSTPASATQVNETTYLFLPLVMREAFMCEPPDLESAISTGIGEFDISTVQFTDTTIDTMGATYELTFESATSGSQTHELLDLNDGNYQLNVSLEEISITYNVTCEGIYCFPVTSARIDVDRMEYQGDFNLGAAYPECTYLLETYDGEVTLTGIEVDTGSSTVDALIALFLDQHVGQWEDMIRDALDNFFTTIIEGAL